MSAIKGGLGYRDPIKLLDLIEIAAHFKIQV